jgi:hypothetical protein
MEQDEQLNPIIEQRSYISSSELNFIVNITLDKQFLLNFVKILNSLYVNQHKIKNKNYQFLENVDQLNSKIFV